MDHFNVITIGRITLDIFLSIDDSNKHFRLNRETNELCIKNGDKAIIDKSQFQVGGNAANVAVGLSRLGLKTAIIAEVGGDDFSEKILNELKKENVYEGLIVKNNNSSSFSIIINYLGDRTIFEEVSKTNNDFSLENLDTDYIYLTSICNNWKVIYSKVSDILNKGNIKLIFNPGTLQLDEGIDGIRDLISKADILFLNKEEGQSLIGDSLKSKTNKEILKELKAIGAKNVIITDGLNGSFGIDENEVIYEQEIIKTNAIERTGAGDAFASGFSAAVINGLSFQEAMLWGSKNAAEAVSVVGSQSGLLTKEDIK